MGLCSEQKANEYFIAFAEGFKSRWVNNDNTETTARDISMPGDIFEIFRNLFEEQVSVLEEAIADRYASNIGDSPVECSHIVVAQNLERMMKAYAKTLARNVGLGRY